MTKTVLYTVGPDLDPDGYMEPHVYGLTVEEAIAMSDEFLVMWSPTYEVFGIGLRSVTPYTRFFYKGQKVINPWGYFKPLPERSTAEPDVTKLFEKFHG